MYTCGLPSFSKYQMRECSRKRPTIERTVMFSLTPGTPGRSTQTPRMIRSIFTPGLRRAIEQPHDARIGQRIAT